MEVILLEKVENVGGIGDQVKVKPGFARNYLLPKGKATLATPENIAKFEARRADLEAKAQAEVEQAQARASKLAGIVLTLQANSGPEGKLFGSIGTVDICRGSAGSDRIGASGGARDSGPPADFLRSLRSMR